jgi:N-acyl-D-amino-acid deacylase
MYEILIKNAIIIDGARNSKYKSDLAVAGGRIQKIKKEIDAQSAKKTIDAENLYLCPGFIDLNNHADTFLTLFTIPGQESLLKQGITTILGGNCGSSLAPLVSPNVISAIQKWADISELNLNWLSFSEYLKVLKTKAIGVNFASLVGHSTLRRGLLKDEFREAKPKEIKTMCEMLKQAMKQGAFGLSTGLAYSHAKIANQKEIADLTKIVKSFEGLYSTHIRGEAEELIPALEETIELAKKTAVNTEILHLKAMGKKNWSSMHKAIDLLNSAGKVKINFDLYPYTSTGSVLYILLPDWVAEGGRKMLLQRLKDPAIKQKVIKEMQEKKEYEYSKITLAMSPVYKSFIGKKITEIAEAQNVSIEEAIINMLLISEDKVIVFLDTLSEENIEKELAHDLSFVASDGAGYNLEFQKKKNDLVHPRCFGAFPRILAKYVVAKHILGWEEAIYKMTFGPAQKIGLKDRGLIKQGLWADIVLLDPEKINDRATFENPYQYPEGIKYVLINGKIAIENSAYTGLKAGKILQKT